MWGRCNRELCSKSTIYSLCQLAVGGCDKASSVVDVTPHHIVGEVWLQDQELWIHLELEDPPKKVKSTLNSHLSVYLLIVEIFQMILYLITTSMNLILFRKPTKRHISSLVLFMYVAVQLEVLPLVCSFQAWCQWCQSTGSQCQHCMCHSSLDSDPAEAGHTPDSKYNTTTLPHNTPSLVLILYNLKLGRWAMITCFFCFCILYLQLVSKSSHNAAFFFLKLKWEVSWRVPGNESTKWRTQLH